jgi:hypothetical protein
MAESKKQSNSLPRNISPHLLKGNLKFTGGQDGLKITQII